MKQGHCTLLSLILVVVVITETLGVTIRTQKEIEISRTEQLADELWFQHKFRIRIHQ